MKGKIIKITSKWLIENDALNKNNKKEMRYIDRVQDLNIIINRLKSLGRHTDCYWLISQLLSKENNIKWSIYNIKLALPMYEKELPNDDRMRKVIEVAENYLNHSYASRDDSVSDANDAVDNIMIARGDAYDDGAGYAFWAAEAARYAILSAYNSLDATLAANAAAYWVSSLVGLDKNGDPEKVMKKGVELLKKEKGVELNSTSTKCPIYKDRRAGSIRCVKCEYVVSYDSKNNILSCSNRNN